MVLYAIITEDAVGKHGIDVSLERASKKLGIVYKRLIVENINLDDLRHMSFPEGSLLYRISLTPKATTAEALLAGLHAERLTTIYSPRVLTYPRRNLLEMILQLAGGLAVIPTHIIDETWLAMDDAQLMQRIEDLGGLPVIVKTLGLSHGQGVARADTAEMLRSLLSKVDFTEYRTIARKYLADYRHYRCIVVDGTVIAAIEYHKPADDFRTNASAEPTVTAVDLNTLDASIQKLALDGVAIRASVLGGVDILVEQPSGKAYLAEVNVPCYFARAEEPTGIDIAAALIQAMVRKQKGESRT